MKIGKHTYGGAGKEGQWCLVRRVPGAVEFFTITDAQLLVGFTEEAAARKVAAFLNRSQDNMELLEYALETFAVAGDNDNGWTGDAIAANTGRLLERLVEMVRRIRQQ